MDGDADEEVEVPQDADVTDIIHVHFDEGVSGASSHSLNSVTRTKYYKQTYRTAWEQMPDFKGWLRGVPGEPTRAYCLYCRKTLHAHRLSLLKHTCTIRHQKAAQIHSIRFSQERGLGMQQQEDISQECVDNAASSQEEGDVEESELIEYVQHPEVDGEDDMENEQDDQEQEEVEEEEEPIRLHAVPGQFQKQFCQQISNSNMATGKPPISTHVLDTSKGIAVAGLQVSLYKLIDGRWTYINEGVTNTDGRFANFLEKGDFTPGRYKLHYDVDRFFEAKKQDTLYPFIEIVFDCRAPTDHYHIPLLLSPFGYTTYRGT